MLFFYEGLPRAGKSYSCIKDYIIPQLLKKRHVYAYVEGLDHVKIAEAGSMMVEQVKEFLHVLTREDVPNIHMLHTVANDSFVVIDELQNFWPKSRAPLSEAMTQFIAEHGHRGLDILCMGQVLVDCHATWVNRMAQKVVFIKREAAGKPLEFNMILFKPVLSGDRMKWKEIHRIKGQKYDSKYFGCYKSHTDGTDNKETFVDTRATVWSSPILRKWLPIYGALLLLSFYMLYNFFHTGAGLQKDSVVKPAQVAQGQVIPAPVVHPVQPVAVQPSAGLIGSSTSPIVHASFIPEPEPDLIDKLSKDNRIRLAASVSMGRISRGVVEWRGTGFERVESLSFDQISHFGWAIMSNSSGDLVELRKGSRSIIATGWPLPDRMGVIPKTQEDRIKPL